MRSHRTLSTFVLGAATALSGCAKAPPRDHVTLTTVDTLRAAFNADSGKVRAIFLASPT